MKNRREFLKGAAALGAFNLVPAKVLAGATAPSNQVTRALIGFGCIAHSANHLTYKGTRLIGVCDPFKCRAEDGVRCAAEKGWGKIKTYRDFLELLADRDVDVVHVITPPHWHGCMDVLAAKAGKDLWAEKPMTRTLGEGLRVAQVVREEKRVFRLNTWFRFQGQFYGFGAEVKPVRKLVESGFFGNGPRRVTIGVGQGLTWGRRWSGKPNNCVDPMPEDFDWDMWLGPAPWRPFNAHRVSTDFRGYWDYDSGDLGDMCQHFIDPVQYLLDKDETSPVRVDYEGPAQHPEAVGCFDRITLTYADGDQIVLDGNATLTDAPFILGSNGARVYGKPFRAVDENGKDFGAKGTVALAAALPDPKPQITDFMESVRTRKPFALNEQNGMRSCALIQLGAAAMRLGHGFDFDPETMRAKDEAANRYLYQPLRDPWHKLMFG